jgi:hypothetical protein
LDREACVRDLVAERDERGELSEELPLLRAEPERLEPRAWLVPEARLRLEDPPLRLEEPPLRLEDPWLRRADA